MKLQRAFLAVIISQVISTTAVHADEILLKNGDKISGAIVSKTEETVLIKTSFAGEIAIQWDAVSKLTSDTPITVKLDDGAVLKGK